MNAGRMLARLDRAMKAHKLSANKFHEKFGLQEYAEIASFKYQWREGLKGDSKTDKKKKIWYTRFSMGDDPRGDAHD